jgi:transcriptional regulator EpsA
MTLSPAEVELLLLNLDAAIRVRQRSQFFLWTQGQLQSLIPHRLLLCAARSGKDERSPYHIDWFSRDPLSEEQSARLGFERGGFLAAMMEVWQRGGGSVWFVEPGEMSELHKLPRWLDRMHLGWHGTMDAFGGTVSLFLFASDGPFDRARHSHFVELLVPHLSSALVRSMLGLRSNMPRSLSEPSVLTDRQLEVLRYVQQGKTNSEIGSLLEISPLTVKNHVQSLLRKLNAQNRAQAVSFGIEQRIIQARWETSTVVPGDAGGKRRTRGLGDEMS